MSGEGNSCRAQPNGGNPFYVTTQCDTVSFQEPQDPFIEGLQGLIDEMRLRADRQAFKKALDKIYERFPFVDLPEFLEMYVNGEYSKELIKKFNLSGYSEYKSLLQILKLGAKRRSSQKSPHAREMNLTDSKMASRYKYLRDTLGQFRQYVRDKAAGSVLRMIMILQLYRNEEAFESRKKVISSMSDTIKDFKHLVPEYSAIQLPTSRERIERMAEQILHDLEDESLLETDHSGHIRLERHQLRIPHYILHTIQGMEGITHQKLVSSLKERLPIMSHMPQVIFLVMLDELVASHQIIRKEGYWKFKPYYDEYFMFESYLKFESEVSASFKKNKQFFGRTIMPDEFINEIIELQRGDFEDQDDQVTRIAGMILSNSNMMTHPPNDLGEFDFAVDLSSYEFTKQQQKVMQSPGLDIRSNIAYVKVMINDRITGKEISDLSSRLKDRGRGEQGLVISFVRPDARAKKMLKIDKTVQLISEDGIREWCKITPVIPARRGAVAVVRQGDHKDSIVRIESVNYESGRADIVLFPNMAWGTQYIGSLEEITLPVGTEKFVDYSSKYFGFLGKLHQISRAERFRSIVVDGLTVISDPKRRPEVAVSLKKIECDLDERSKTLVDLTDSPNLQSLEYSTDGLFSCTCFRWRHKSKTYGLCGHLIFTLNEAVKEILSYASVVSDDDIERTLAKIEQKMDAFLCRLRYSSTNRSSTARCPSCGETASTLDEVRDLFGYRQMNKGNRFSLRRQSRCKKCR